MMGGVWDPDLDLGFFDPEPRATAAAKAACLMDGGADGEA